MRQLRGALTTMTLGVVGLLAACGPAADMEPEPVAEQAPAQTSVAESNKAALRAFLDEALNQGRLEAIDELLADDYVDHSPMPGAAPTKEGLKEVFTVFREAFPDLEVTVEDMIAEDDKVAVRVTSRGTHQGALMGIEPTGQSIEIAEIHIVRFVDGRAVEHWGVEDNLGMMQQLGVIPAQPE